MNYISIRNSYLGLALLILHKGILEIPLDRQPRELPEDGTCSITLQTDKGGLTLALLCHMILYVNKPGK